MNLDDKQQRLHTKLKAEMGPVILAALGDAAVLEVLLNPDGHLWVERMGCPMEKVGEMTPLKARSLLGTIASSLGTTITSDNPVLEGELITDGSRVEGIIPPITSAPSFVIRKHAIAVYSLADYEATGVMTGTQHQIILQAIRQHDNILVAGGTGSGKTTLVNALIQAITHAYPEERLILLEDTTEIQATAENILALRTSPQVSMKALLRATLRLRPDRILVGEVRGEEALTLLKAWNTGHPGGIATVHANDVHTAIGRMEQLVAESGTGLAKEKLIAESIDLIIGIEKYHGKWRLTELLKVEGYDAQSGYVISSHITGATL